VYAYVCICVYVCMYVFVTSVRKSAPNGITALLVLDGAHHLDLRTSNPSDPPSVKGMCVCMYVCM